MANIVNKNFPIQHLLLSRDGDRLSISSHQNMKAYFIPSVANKEATFKCRNEMLKGDIMYWLN